MDPYQIIKTVSFTEKSSDLGGENKYVFVVDRRAHKPAIKKAVEEIFGRKIAAVNVMNCIGKTKRTRYGVGQKPNWKKAIVTLKKGEDPIDLV